MSDEKRNKSLTGLIVGQVMLIGILWMADRIFFFFEQNFFNTYLDHVLGLEPLYISVMVALSATMGLIMNFVFGVLSDNTRSRWGRRRPYFLFALIAGAGMILYALGNDFFPVAIQAYIWCVIIDVIVIGISSNAVSVSQRAIIPDVVDLEHRGRANGIIQAVSYIGLIIALAFFLLADLLFGETGSGGGTIITPFGHFILLTIGGVFYAICGLVGFLAIREKPASELPPKKKFGQQLGEMFNFGALIEQKNFFKILLAATIFQTGIGTVMAFLFIYLFGLGLSTLELLIAIAIGFICLFPITILLGRLADKFGRKKFMPLIIIIISVAYILVYFVTFGGSVNFILFVILIPFVLVGLLGLDTIINAWSQDTLPENMRGSFYGIFNVVYTISQVIGSFIGGLAAQFLELPWIFVFGAIFFLASIPLFLLVKETLVKDENL